MIFVDLGKSIRVAVDTGEVSLGAGGALKRALHGDGKLLVIASNCPREKKEDLERYAKLSNLPVVEFAGTSVQLGVACGKPFPVSALTVIEEGNSDVLKAVEKA